MKIGRNDPCPCGNVDNQGKALKYKKCCLLKFEELDRIHNLEWEQWFAQDLALGQINKSSIDANAQAFKQASIQAEQTALTNLAELAEE